jgi:hypothetical protein
MTTMKLLTLLGAVLMTALSLSTPAHAGPGHDHGDAAPAVTGPALPRFAAVSDAFELVGIVNGKLITLYLDRAADNAPVEDARIELDIAGVKYVAEKHDDAFEVVLPEAPKPGVIPITAVITAGQETDLLAGELDTHAEEAAGASTLGWQRLVLWALGGLLGLAVLILSVRRVARTRHLSTGAAA